MNLHAVLLSPPGRNQYPSGGYCTFQTDPLLKCVCGVYTLATYKQCYYTFRRYRVKETGGKSRSSRGHIIEGREDYIQQSERCLPGMEDTVTAPLKCPLPGHTGSKNDYTHIWERPLPVPNEVHIVSNSNINTNGTGSVSY